MKGTELVAATIVGVVLISTVTPVAGATAAESPERSFVVDLAADGSATVTMTSTFDLTTANESEAFEQLQTDQQARERFRSSFRDRMSGVAADAANETGREMSITESSIDVRTVGDTGVVELSVTWDGLAAVEDDTVTVTEPFASGFEPDREFRLSVPDGYAATSVEPEADSSTDGTLRWDAGSALDDFAVTVEPTDDATIEPTESETGDASPTGTSGGDGAGFGVGVAVTALLGAGFLAARRR